MSLGILPSCLDFDPPASIWKSWLACWTSVSGTSSIACQAMSSRIEFACCLGMRNASDAYLEWLASPEGTPFTFGPLIFASVYAWGQVDVVCPSDTLLSHVLLHGTTPKFLIPCKSKCTKLYTICFFKKKLKWLNLQY